MIWLTRFSRDCSRKTRIGFMQGRYLEQFCFPVWRWLPGVRWMEVYRVCRNSLKAHWDQFMENWLGNEWACLLSFDNAQNGRYLPASRFQQSALYWNRRNGYRYINRRGKNGSQGGSSIPFSELKLFTLLAPTTISHNPATPKIINIDHCIKAFSSAANWMLNDFGWRINLQ